MKIQNVILVEDDEDDQSLFSTFFADRTDIRLLPTVGNGLELIDFLERASSDDELPGLIILDQNMPKMNGKQTLKFLKSSDRYSKIPTVVYSTYADTNLIVDCKRLGALMVAVKPIDHEGYQKMMNDFLKVFSK
jgi:CheY-like chemotaxis protein